MLSILTLLALLASGCLPGRTNDPYGDDDYGDDDNGDDDSVGDDDDVTAEDDDDNDATTDDDDATSDDDATAADDDTTPVSDDDSTPISDDDSTPPPDDDTTPSDDDSTPPPSEPGLFVELNWDVAGDDFDLHLVRGAGVVEDSEEDCYYANCTGSLAANPDWGEAEEEEDNPALIEDDIEGNGPEQVQILEPEDTFFTVWVHDYPGSTYEEVNEAVVSVWAYGELLGTRSFDITGEDTITKVVRITYPTEAVVWSVP